MGRCERRYSTNRHRLQTDDNDMALSFTYSAERGSVAPLKRSKNLASGRESIVSLIVSRQTFFEVKWSEVVVSRRITQHRDRPMPAEVK